jgi:hypothetical protein
VNEVCGASRPTRITCANAAGAVDRAKVGTTERHHELVARLAAERRRKTTGVTAQVR